jgi:hypothetical protein
VEDETRIGTVQLGAEPDYGPDQPLSEYVMGFIDVPFDPETEAELVIELAL